jgi:hypothetical protein
MVDDQLVERVARAMYDATHAKLRCCYSWEDEWEPHQEPLRERYLNEARAAIAALTPSPEQGWQPIDEHYQVSRSGEVRRSDGLLLKQWTNSQGYKLVRLNHPRRVERVHRLVATAFVPNPENKPFVNHLNNDRADNRDTNLEWCTQWENIAHADRQGRMQRDYWVGKRTPIAKLSDEDAAAIRAAYAAGGVSWAELGRRYGVSKRSIGRLVNGETYV